MRRTKTRPRGRPAPPGQEGTHTHTRTGPGRGVLRPQKGAVWASTRKSPGAPAQAPVERRTVRETGRVSDRVHTRTPPQRTQPKTNAGGNRQGQSHRGAPNGYDAERVHRRCLGSGHRQTQRARFLAGLHVPRAAAQYIRGRKPPWWRKAPRRQENRPEHRERLDRTRRGAPTRGHQARQRGTPLATTKAQGQVPSNNSHRVPQTRAACTTRNEPRHRNRCHATANPHNAHPSRKGRSTSRARRQTHTRTPARSGWVQLKKVPSRTGPCCTPSTITRHSQGLAPHQGLHFHKK